MFTRLLASYNTTNKDAPAKQDNNHGLRLEQLNFYFMHVFFIPHKLLKTYNHVNEHIWDHLTRRSNLLMEANVHLK